MSTNDLARGSDEVTRPREDRLSLIERWNIEGGSVASRTAIVVSGRMPRRREQIRMVRAEDYDALADQLRGAVDVLREIAEADPVDMALDPGWAARVAWEYLNPSTTTRGQ